MISVNFHNNVLSQILFFFFKQCSVLTQRFGCLVLRDPKLSIKIMRVVFIPHIIARISLPDKSQ